MLHLYKRLGKYLSRRLFVENQYFGVSSYNVSFSYKIKHALHFSDWFYFPNQFIVLEIGPLTFKLCHLWCYCYSHRISYIPFPLNRQPSRRLYHNCSFSCWRVISKISMKPYIRFWATFIRETKEKLLKMDIIKWEMKARLHFNM